MPGSKLSNTIVQVNDEGYKQNFKINKDQSWIPLALHFINSISNLYIELIFTNKKSEPFTKVAPRMTSGDGLKRLKVAQNEKVSLIC